MAKNGFTLVELLIGMLIGMLCIIILLMLFKQISRVGMVSARDAEYDAQLETGVLIAQKLIQNAGYGSGNAADIATGFVTFTSDTAANATTTGQPAIFWRVSPDPNATTKSFDCYGLAERISASGANQIHRLMYLTKENCDSPIATSPANPNLNQMADWTATPIVRVDINANEVTEAATAAGVTPDAQARKPIFTFNRAGSCSPYGIQNVQGGAKVTITGNRLNVIRDSGNLGQSIQRAVCLRNIP